MEVGSGDNAASQRIAQRRQQQELEEQRIQLDIAKTRKERENAIAAEREKGDRAMVEISNAASQQVETARKMNSERVRSLSETQRKSYEELAKRTAEDLERLNVQAFDAIQAHKAGTMDKIRSVTDRGEDPFYRMKSLDPVLGETDGAYTIQVKLPEHEARNLFVAAEGAYVKLALNRRFQDDVRAPDGGRTTRTSSYQSVVEQVAMPGAYDAKKIERNYENGVMTIRFPKLAFGPTPKG